MTRLVAFALVLLAEYCHASQRIVGGNPTTVYNYPSLVQVDSFNRWTEVWSQNCAAAIINNVNVLSAAHCFHGTGYEAAHRRVRAGATYRNTGGVVIGVTKEVNHPSFDFVTLDNDITVVRLSAPMPYGETIQPSFIPPQGSLIAEGLPARQAGWGLIAADAPSSSVLLYTEVFTINRQLCAQRYLASPTAKKVTENMICSGLLDIGGRGSCGGDAGGPLFYENIIIGIISFSEGCGEKDFPSVSAAVAPNTDWIVATAEAVTI